MRFVFASYIFTKAYNDPESWIDRIKAYTGIMEALAQNNEVIRIEQINYEGEYQKNGVQYHFGRFKPGTLFPSKFHNFIKSQRPDVVVIGSLHFPLQVIQLRLKLGKKVKIIVQNHAEKPYRGVKKILQKIADRYITAYLFASDELGVEWVVNGLISSARKVHEVMEVSSVFSPMDKIVAKAKTGITESLVFLWVGRLNDNKDPLTAIRAFLQYAAENEHAKLYMIYHTDELLSEIQGLIQNSSQKEAIKLIGKVPHAELQYWYNSADIILSGSHYEGSGTAVCEAMSCGCMPIVTNIASFRMITDNGKCGLLYEPGNEKALLATLEKIVTINLSEKRERSLSYFKANLSFEAIAERFQKIADSL